MTLAKIYAPAVWLGALTCFGLLSALLGDDLWDALSWITLAIPIVVITWHWIWPAK